VTKAPQKGIAPKEEISAEKLDTRNMTAQEAVQKLYQAFKPLAWKTKPPTLELGDNYVFKPLKSDGNV